MKKILLSVIFIVLALNNSNAQQLSAEPIESIKYNNNNNTGIKQMIIIDSSVFNIRSGGLEELNTTQQIINYF